MSIVNSSDDIAYLPPNCFLTKVTDGGGRSSFELLELAISISVTSLQLNKRVVCFISQNPKGIKLHTRKKINSK